MDTSKLQPRGCGQTAEKVVGAPKKGAHCDREGWVELGRELEIFGTRGQARGSVMWVRNLNNSFVSFS